MSLEEVRKKFYVALEALKIDVHTQEDLDAQRKIAEEAFDILWEIDPEFREQYNERKRETSRRIRQIKAGDRSRTYPDGVQPKVDDMRLKADELRSEAKEQKRLEKEKEIESWVQEHRIKIRSQEEAEKALQDNLVCPNPKCTDYGKNRKNIINGVPTCFRCWHVLVPKSKVKNYNRKYWRRWSKLKK